MTTCPNCGDTCGWTIWQSRQFSTGDVLYVWVACAICNPEGEKAKPELCKTCNETPALCVCASVPKMD